MGIGLNPYLNFLAKNPPSVQNIARRLFDYLVDSDPVYASGVAAARDKLNASQAQPKPRNNAPIQLAGELAALAAGLQSVDPEVRVSLASWDVLQAIKVVDVGGGNFVLEFLGVRSGIVETPSAKKLEAAVVALDKKMSGSKGMNREEMLFGAASPDILMTVGLEETPPPGKPAEPVFNLPTLEVVDALSAIVWPPLQMLKYKLGVPRPDKVPVTQPGGGKKTIIRPVIPVPNHASLPGGHAMLAAAAATVLAGIAGGGPVVTGRLSLGAREIAERREESGLHTQLDTDAGVMLGSWLGEQLISIAENQPKALPHWSVLYALATHEWP